MDFDDEDKPKEVTKARRFAPGRAGKPKPKPKPKPEPTASEKAEPSSQAESVSKSEHDVDAKVEPEVFNGSAVKMEIDPKVDKEPETTTMEVDLMEVDHNHHQLPLHQEEEEKMEEEEDVVVREIDVFFNPSIDANTKLYVLQYPLRPSWRAYEMDERCEEVRVNPSTSQVEIDLSMDVHSSNYDPERGSELRMTKQTLTTTWKQPPTLDYAVGVLSGDKLHLNPVHAVVQLRPSMQYLSTKKNQAAEAPEESAGTSKRQNKGVQATEDQKPDPEDKWVSLKYHGLQSDFYSKYLNGMMANGNSSIDFNMTPDAYINSLCRGVNSRNFESKALSKRALASLPLEERLETLLCQKHGPPVFRYSVLKHHAPELSDEDFLTVLQRYACLVQGLWTPKTSLLKLDGAEGVFRDYILALFSKSLTIKYAEVKSIRISDKIKTMLNVYAKDRPLLCDWKFREPPDVSFIKSHKMIAAEQAELWKEVEEEIKTNITKQGGGKGNSSSRSAVGKNNPSATTTAAKQEVPKTVSEIGGSSRSAIPRVPRQRMPDDIKRAIPKALKKVFQTQKVCSYETICQRLRDLAVATSNNPRVDSGMAQQVALAVDSYQEELQVVIGEMTVDIHGSFVSKSSLDHPEYDPLRDVVINLLLGNPPGAKIMKADVFAAGRSILGREITTNEYQKVMHDLCETHSSGWILQRAR